MFILFLSVLICVKDLRTALGCKFNLNGRYATAHKQKPGTKNQEQPRCDSLLQLPHRGLQPPSGIFYFFLVENAAGMYEDNAVAASTCMRQESALLE